MKLITFRIQISNQFFKSLISSFNTSTRIQYWNHSSSSRILRNHICFISKRSSFFRLDVELNIIASKTTRTCWRKIFLSILYWHYSSCSRILRNSICFTSTTISSLSLQRWIEYQFFKTLLWRSLFRKRQKSSSNIIHRHSESRSFFLLKSIQELHLFSYQSIHFCLVSTMTSKQRKREVRKREAQKQAKLKAAKSASFATFSSSESATNQTISLTSSKSSASQKQQKLEISTSNRCQWCQLDYDIWNSHSFQYSSCVARNQQAYEFVLQFLEELTSEIIEKSTVFITFASQKQQKSNISSENLKAIKKTKINVVKNAKRVKSKTLKTQAVAKSTSEFQNIDIFDSTLTYENRRFNEIAHFLQHFQQCQHLYRKSNLIMLLLNCLWDSVFDIWYDK